MKRSEENIVNLHDLGLSKVLDMIPKLQMKDILESLKSKDIGTLYIRLETCTKIHNELLQII